MGEMSVDGREGRRALCVYCNMSLRSNRIAYTKYVLLLFISEGELKPLTMQQQWLSLLEDKFFT